MKSPPLPGRTRKPPRRKSLRCRRADGPAASGGGIIGVCLRGERPSQSGRRRLFPRGDEPGLADTQERLLGGGGVVVAAGNTLRPVEGHAARHRHSLLEQPLAQHQLALLHARWNSMGDRAPRLDAQAIDAVAGPLVDGLHRPGRRGFRPRPHLCLRAVHLEGRHGMSRERVGLGDPHRDGADRNVRRIRGGRQQHIAGHRLRRRLQHLEAARIQEEPQLSLQPPQVHRVRQVACPRGLARVQEEGHIQPQRLSHDALAGVDAHDAVHRQVPQLDDIQRAPVRIRDPGQSQKFAHGSVLLRHLGPPVAPVLVGPPELLAQGGQHLRVPLLHVALQRLLAPGDPREELPQRLAREVPGMHPVSQPLQVEPVDDLLELPLHGDREHWLVQIHRLAHQRVPASSHHRARRAQILDEALLAEGPVGEVAFHLVLGDLPAHAVDAAGQPALLEDLRQPRVGGGGLVHEQVLTGLGLGRQDLRTQDGGGQRGALLAHRWVEERGDEVVKGPRQLAFDDGPRALEGVLVPRQQLRLVAAPVDDLHVVHADHRQPVGLGEQVAERLEVADDHLRAERLHQLEILADVLRPAGHRPLEVLEHRLPLLHRVALVRQGKPPDAVHILKAPGQVLLGPARDDDVHLVLPGELLEQDPGARRVAHALAHHSIEDPHGAPAYAGRGARARAVVASAHDRCLEQPGPPAPAQPRARRPPGAVWRYVQRRGLAALLRPEWPLRKTGLHEAQRARVRAPRRRGHARGQGSDDLRRRVDRAGPVPHRSRASLPLPSSTPFSASFHAPSRAPFRLGRHVSPANYL
ncbi:hypothetical protein STIAU_2169 [Stigmatella aurantiaca DW4/3-1]|uniref:Uncharacterized protein n=1 Tax=Stigmatella aurantiaca (strain DW4/3-1) TaxID=378806 RepID=Q08Y25_STIAD|nr:hypothetical protein STIAU_2169 [Stigmatella aurantiaca DW4/3-1]